MKSLLMGAGLPTGGANGVLCPDLPSCGDPQVVEEAPELERYLS